MELEIPLIGGRSTTGVVRIGDTVRRPVRPNSVVAHELLRHLEIRGFDGAPRFVGIDDAGREILTFMPGAVPTELGHFSDTQLNGAARLLRRFHDATLDCALRNGYEVMCHGDASPCNCVLVDQLPMAFIDFDDIHPGSRLDDVGYATWLWIDIGNDDLAPEQQVQRVADFFRCYGLSAHDAVLSIIAAQAALAERTRSAGVREWADSCRSWVERNRDRFSAAIAERSNQSIQPTCEDHAPAEWRR